MKAYLYTWGEPRYTAEGDRVPAKIEDLDIGYIDGMLLLPLVEEHNIDERSPLCGHTHESLMAVCDASVPRCALSVCLWCVHALSTCAPAGLMALKIGLALRHTAHIFVCSQYLSHHLLLLHAFGILCFVSPGSLLACDVQMQAFVSFVNARSMPWHCLRGDDLLISP